MAVDRQGQLWIWGKADARLGLGSLGSSNSDLGIEVEQSNSIKLPMMHTVLKGYVERTNHRDQKNQSHSSSSKQNHASQRTNCTRVVKAVAAFEHSLVMTSTGQLLTFGINNCGKLGIHQNVLRGTDAVGE